MNIKIKKILLNEEIESNEIMLIEDEQVSYLNKQEALQLAKSRNLDLVQFSVQKESSVCKIISYQKLLFQQKKQQKSNTKPLQCKELRIGLSINQPDLINKLNATKKFLLKGNHVKIVLTFLGREQHNMDKILSITNCIQDHVEKIAQISSSTSNMKKAVKVLMLTPKAKIS